MFNVVVEMITSRSKEDEEEEGKNLKMSALLPLIFFSVCVHVFILNNGHF